MLANLNLTFDEEQKLDFNIRLAKKVEKALNEFNFFVKEKNVTTLNIKILATSVEAK